MSYRLDIEYDNSTEHINTLLKKVAEYLHRAQNERMGLENSSIWDVKNPESVILGWIQKEVKAPNVALADIAIKLGVHDSWRQTLIDRGGRIGKTKDGKALNEPFETLLPNLIKNASVKQLDAYIKCQGLATP